MNGPAAAVEISQLIDSRPLSRLQVWIIVVCALSVVFDGFDLQVMALTVPTLSKAWSLPPASFSAALSASLLGMGLGAAFVAPLGDRFGRRAVCAAALVLVGIGALACAAARSTGELALYRFGTGIGLGAAMSNALALTADYMPSPRRAALITAMYCNTATGALLASFTAPALIERFGWQGPFLAGGLLPIAAAVLLLASVPESLKFLLHRRPADRAVAGTLARLAPEVDAAGVFLAPPPEAARGVLPDLLTPRYRRRTLWLWVGYAMNAFVLYLLVSWLPTLLVSANWSNTQALHAVAFNQVGGILGGLSLAWLMDRMGYERTLLAGFLLCVTVLLAFLIAPSQFWTWGAMLLVVGACIGGAQFAIPSLAVMYYPPAILATGTGWASAAARTGAFIAPLLGGALIARGMQTSDVLSLLAIPAAVAALAMLLLARLRDQTL